jgi:hypothetical protein
MLVIGLVLNVFGIGLFCWLIFTLAVYALPFFIGLTAGMAASVAARASSVPSSQALVPERWRLSSAKLLSPSSDL